MLTDFEGEPSPRCFLHFTPSDKRRLGEFFFFFFLPFPERSCAELSRHCRRCRGLAEILRADQTPAASPSGASVAFLHKRSLMLLRCEASPRRGARREEPSEEMKGSERSLAHSVPAPAGVRPSGCLWRRCECAGDAPLALVKAARVDKLLGFRWRRRVPRPLPALPARVIERARCTSDESMKTGNIYLLIRYQIFKTVIHLWKAVYLALCLQFAAEIDAQFSDLLPVWDLISTRNSRRRAEGEEQTPGRVGGGDSTPAVTSQRALFQHKFLKIEAGKKEQSADFSFPFFY